jgi:hypothetical protein
MCHIDLFLGNDHETRDKPAHKGSTVGIGVSYVVHSEAM